ncbi:MAG: DUF4253 domain-containing protein [Deltaproteobacteria bacterium]|jgi:uncharacterized protein YfeS|nr:DUF4253 domain-containing protein [Deltaproteobacteria bacterium]
MQAFKLVYGLSAKIWIIDHWNTFCSVYTEDIVSGNQDFKITQFRSLNACLTAVNKKISDQEKKGYVLFESGMPVVDYYYDVDKYGLHPMTSHPRFRDHFTSDFYYNSLPSEVPFDGEYGLIALRSLEDMVSKSGETNVPFFSSSADDDETSDNDEIIHIDVPFESAYNETTGALSVTFDGPEKFLSNIVKKIKTSIAAAFGGIKIMGYVFLRSLSEAIEAIDQLENLREGRNLPPSKILSQMRQDLLSFKNPEVKPSEAAKGIIELLGLEATVFPASRHNDDDFIFSYNNSEFNDMPDGKPGFTPLLIVPDDQLLNSLKDKIKSYKVQNLLQVKDKILAEAKMLEGQHVLHELGRKAKFNKIAFVNKMGRPSRNLVFPQSMSLEFPEKPERQIPRELILVKIPTDNSWELPAWLPMGGFNDCPEPTAQVAVTKYWQNKYSVVPALVTSEGWDFHVPSDIDDYDGALELVKEQIYFCPSLLGFGPSQYQPGDLAALLVTSEFWSFKWPRKP